MPKDPDSAQDTERHIAEVRRISEWLDGTGVRAPGMAVDFADALYAADQIRGLLNTMIGADLADEAAVEIVLEDLGTMHALLFSELKPHVRDLERHWSKLERALISKSKRARETG